MAQLSTERAAALGDSLLLPDSSLFCARSKLRSRRAVVELLYTLSSERLFK